MEPAVFVSERKALSVKNNLVSIAQRNRIEVHAKVFPLHRRGELRGYRVSFKTLDTERKYVTEEMVA